MPRATVQHSWTDSYMLALAVTHSTLALFSQLVVNFWIRRARHNNAWHRRVHFVPLIFLRIIRVAASLAIARGGVWCVCVCDLRNFDEKQQQHNYIINAFRAGNALRARAGMCVLLPVRQTTEDNEYDIIKSIISFMHVSGTLHTSVSQASVVAASGTEGNYFRNCFTFFINIEIELIY